MDFFIVRDCVRIERTDVEGLEKTRRCQQRVYRFLETNTDPLSSARGPFQKSAPKRLSRKIANFFPNARELVAEDQLFPGRVLHRRPPKPKENLEPGSPRRLGAPKLEERRREAQYAHRPLVESSRRAGRCFTERSTKPPSGLSRRSSKSEGGSEGNLFAPDLG